MTVLIQAFRIFFMAFLFVNFLGACQSDVEKPTIPEIRNEKATYIGSESCKSCHETEYAKWTQSHHFHAMEEPSDTSVLANWNTTFEADGMHHVFFKKGESFKVKLTEQGVIDTLDVVATFGFFPLQQYLFVSDNGKLQTMRATWDSEQNKWFNQHAGETIPKHDWLHQDGQSMTWNSMCASCHSTNLKKGYDVQNNRYTTTYSYINLGCESCHGAGSKHVAFANDSVNYSNEKSGLVQFEPGIAGLIDQCGGCHSRREQLYDNPQPGDKFHDAFNVAWLDDRLYFPDGQIRDEDYVVGSFLSSKMHKNGIMCINCHDSHTMELLAEGNQLCMTCHEPKYDSKEHHFHKEDDEGARCVNCHMDGAYYMGNDFRRDHSFRIPRPDQSVAYNTPNACNSCHDDKSAEWSANKIVEWYGKERAPHFSDRLLSGQVEGNYALLIELASDTAEPAIIRGTAIHTLAESQILPKQQELESWMNDEDYLVRKAALEIVRILPIEEKVAYVSRGFQDDARSVRIGALKSALNVPSSQIPPAYSMSYNKALNEYLVYLDNIADFPDGQAQRAQYFYNKGDYESAIIAYKRALVYDSIRVDFRTNLAITYSSIGQNRKALYHLDLCIAQEATDRLYYLRGLLYAELGDLSLAELDLQNAIELSDQNPTYFYNLILIKRQQGRSDEANNLLRMALRKFPQDQRIISLK